MPALYIIPEAQPNAFATGRDLSLKQLFSTHPSTEARIERLEALK